MNRACFSKNCQSKVAFSCNCKANTFSCLDHLGQHMITQGQHMPTPFIASVDETKIKDIQGKIIKVHNYYDILKLKVKIATLELIQKIEQSYNKLIEKIAKQKRINLDLLNDALYNSTVDIEVLKKIEETEEFDESLLEFKLTDQIISIEEVFNIDIENVKKNLLFFNSTCKVSNILNIIDLSTFKKTAITLPVSDMYSYCASCDLGNFTYFLYGGYTPIVGSARLVNIKNRTVTPLPCSSPTFLSGACLYNEKVYVFGGCSDGSTPLNLAQQFDLKNKSWSSLCSLPVASYRTTGSVIYGKIYTTGYQMSNVLVYSPESKSYSSFFKLDPNSYKYLLENWIVSTGGGLWEFSNGSFSKYQSPSHSFDNLTIFSSFRRGNFIYFLPNNLQLLRINTKTKSLESVNFSE